MVDEQVDTWLSQQKRMIEHREAAQAQHRAAEVPAGDVAVSTAAELEEMLDLSWLASPWSTVRYLVRQDPDPDLPSMQTDEDARRFVTTMLKEMTQ